MKIFNYLSLICISCFSYSQNITFKDTLKRLNYLDLENKFYNLKNNERINDSKIIAQYYLKKAKFENNKDRIADGYVLMYYNQTESISLKYIDSIEIIKKNISNDIYPTRIYLLKGRLFYDSDNIKLSLENFITALKYAKEKNNKRHIALAELYIAYLNNYIGKHQEAAQILQYYYDNDNYFNSSEQEHIRLNLADTYIDVGNLETALKLIQQGLINTKQQNEVVRYYRYLSLLGRYHLKIKKYKTAINTLERSKTYFIENNCDLYDVSYTMLYLGQSYSGVGQKENVIKNFGKIDSIVQKSNISFPELRYVYTYLIDYYKNAENKEKQLYFIERFLKVDQLLDSQFRYVSRELPKKYDTPNLLQQKEDIINDLENRKIVLYISLGFLIIILLILYYFYYKSKKTEAQHRKIAQDLINSIEVKNFETPEEKLPVVYIQKAEKTETEDRAIKTTPEEITKSILKELDIFETKEFFLHKGITSASLAKNFKTNTTYLSEVINTHKGKNFAAYLNDLRIEYALKKLVVDKRFRSYKLSVIADELGYNNEQAFSLAFKKKTGTTLSIYIKEIEKQII